MSVLLGNSGASVILGSSGGGVVRRGSGLLTSGDISYVGSFQLPGAWGYGHDGAAYNPTNDSLFVGSASHEVGEMTIPTPSASTTFASLPTATIISGQVSTDPSEGNFGNISGLDSGAQHDRVGGLLVNGSDLIVTYLRTYGGNAAQSHLARPLSLASTGSARMWYHVKGGDGRYWNGWTGGAMCHVPSEYQASIGKALTGQNTQSLMSGPPGEAGSGEGRSGWGPTAFAFDPNALTGANGTVVTADPVVLYNKLHYFYGEPGDLPGTLYTHWNQTSQIRGIVFPGGSTRSVLFFGMMGTGTYYYDVITNNISIADTPCDLPGEEGRYWRYDPSSYLTTPNQHANLAWPYRMKVWAYDADDLAAAKAGSVNPWDVLPYGEWILDAPAWLSASASSPNYNTDTYSYHVYGTAFDPTSRRVYLLVRGNNHTGGERAVMVYQLPA